MEDHQYGLSDLRQYIEGRPFFPAMSQPPDLLSCHRGPTPHHPYDMLMIRSDAPPSRISTATAGLGSFAAEPTLGDGGSARWPRQETLTLLEIRSRLDHRFKEANQKGPLWDEVSRIMSEENGYQRSGKKCREKFENLYKYYKKTKEGKAGRQDGKHYRFFRQLEALYGDNSASAGTHFHGGSSFPNSLASDQEGALDSCDYDTTSSYCSDSKVMESVNDDDLRERKRKEKRRLKASIEERIDWQMRSMMEKQDEWMERMTRVIEDKEKERLMREGQWRKQDVLRIEREKEIWASKKAWIEARDSALTEAFNKLAGKEIEPPARAAVQEEDWLETETARLIQNCGKKRRESLKSNYQNHHDPVEGAMLRLNGGDPPRSGGAGETMNDGFFRYFMGESYQRL